MKVPIHITIPYALLKELDAETKNRSQFICRAIRNQFHGAADNSIQDAPTRQLMAALSSRPDCDSTLRKLLIIMLTREDESKQS